MKVLICHRPGGAFGFISDGWLNALQHAKITAKRWDGKAESWYAFKPDVYIGASGHRQPIPRKVDRGNCKIALHVNPCGPIQIKPNINEAHNAIVWVKAQFPSIVFGYGHKDDLPYWSYWERDGIKWVPMATAGDATLYSPVNGPHNIVDIAYIGGYWSYKANNIDKYLIPVISDVGISKLHYGWGNWPKEFGVREAPDSKVVTTLATCRVGPCVSEPHTTIHGIDLPERVFKVILSGAVAVHDPVPNLSKYIPSIIMATTPAEYHNMIKELVRLSDSSRTAIALKQYNDVFNSQTYHHRLATLFKALGFHDEAKALLESLEHLRVI